jgi:phosphotransferase system HPr (HPr) family protein
MVSREIKITNPTGLHTRPGNDFVKAAKQYSCGIILVKGGKSIDGKSLLKLMKLNVVQGDTITVRCDGPDEGAALEALASYLEALTE